MKVAASEVRERSAIEGGFEQAELARDADLHAETLTALGSATSEHQPAATGGHAGTKSVRALAVYVAGLIRALHGRFPSGSAAKISLKTRPCRGDFEGRQGYAPHPRVSRRNASGVKDKYFFACG